MKNKYYIYVFLDSSKPGKYIYDDIEFQYEPFYIGKGCDDRIKSSLFDRESPFKVNKINKLKNNNIDIISIKIYENLENKQSLEVEKETIRKIGRRDFGNGPLVNQTDGGDGRLNSPHSLDTKRKISETKKLQSLSIPHNDDTKEYLRKINTGDKNPFFGKNHSNRVKFEQSERVLGTNHPMWGKKHNQETILLIKENRNKSIDQNLMNQMSKERNSKSVLQYSLNGNFINEYESIKDASIKTGLSESLIGKTCRGIVKSPKKYIFKFKNDFDKVLNNSYKIKIGDFVKIEKIEYKLIKRNKRSFVVEYDGQHKSFKKNEYSFIWDKKVL
jgi:hypothetical protein